jgi:hypothetical protein
MSYIKEEKITNLEEAALLSRTKDATILKLLLDACLKGESLENLKRLTDRKDKYKYKENVRKGRPITLIKLGSTTNISLVKRIIDAILTLENYSHYKNIFVNTKWESQESVNNAFKKLLGIMEKIEK